MGSPKSIFYFVHDSELMDDGVLRVRFGGSDSGRLVDGVHDVSPNDPDYKFWLWLRSKRKARWFRPVSGILEDDLHRYREEYKRDHQIGFA